MKKAIFLLFASLMFSQCVHYSLYYLEAGGVRPGEPNFKFKLKPPADSIYRNIIDTNAVYIQIVYGHGDNGSDLYEAIRFFSDGRCFETHLHDTLKDLEEAYNDPVNNGTIGYFKVEKNYIITEILVLYRNVC